MLDLKDEKRDVESFISAGVKKLKTPQKQRLADIMLGMQLADEDEPHKKNGPSYPTGSVQATCL